MAAVVVIRIQPDLAILSSLLLFLLPYFLLTPGILFVYISIKARKGEKVI